MSDLLRWFGEQSDAVKIALIGLFGGISASFWAAVKEWRKPVLNAPAKAVTTPTAPRSEDDPLLLLLSEVAAMNVVLNELLTVTRDGVAGQGQRVDKVLTAVVELSHQIERLRDKIAG